MRVSWDKDIREMNTFGMRVWARCVAEYDSVEELARIIAKVGVADVFPRPFLSIGGGSNLLFTKDFHGTLLHSCIRHCDEVGSLVKVGAGVRWDDFCGWCAERGLWGPENLSMIPGDVGAAAVQNIGAYGREVGELVESVECFDTETLSVVSLPRERCLYGYRESVFKNRKKGRLIVTSVSFRLSKSPLPVLDYGDVGKEVEEALSKGGGSLTPAVVRDVIMDIRRRKLPDPSEVGSAGSFFRNPFVPKALYQKIAASNPDVPHFDMPDGSVKIPAAWLIDQCGWKNHREGNVGVWSQPLVIVNASGHATPCEVVALEKKIMASVEERFGITLVPEVEHI